MAKKKPAKKQTGPLAGRHVVVVGPTVRLALITADQLQESLKLKERPSFVVRLPQGLAQFDKVAVVAAPGTAIDASWALKMSRDLDNVVFYTSVELLI